MNSIRVAVGSALVLALAACGGGGGGGKAGSPNNGGNGSQTFNVSGSVAGLSGSGLTLGSNGQTLAVGANGTFTFASGLASGTAYNITVATQPSSPTQTCSIANGSGTLSANVSNIAISCVTATFTLGGTISGLTGSGLTLSNNGQSLALAGDGTFLFPVSLASGTAYAVSVATQPEGPAQDCAVANGSGTLTNTNVASIAITCVAAAPLTIINSTPVADARDVARDNTFTLDFSSALNPATVNTNTVVLRNSIAGQQGIDVAISGSRITVTPRWRLLPATPYTLTIDTAVRSSRGQVMAAPATLSFTTSEGNWQTSTYIENTTNRVRTPQIATNGSSVVAVWMEEDVGIGLNRYVSGTGWAGRQELASGTGSNNPQVAVDSQGTSHLVWTRFLNPAFSLEGTQYSPASGFGTTQLVENDDVSSVSKPRLAVDGQDTIFAIWRYGSGTSSTDGSAWTNRYSAGSGWGDITRIDSTPRGIFDPRIAVDRAGNAFATWTQRDLSGRNRIFANRYVVGANWFIPVRVDNVATTSNAIDSHVAVDAAGNAIAIYRYEVTASDDAIGASRFTVANGWSTPVTFDSSSSEIDEAKLAVDTAGNAMAVWIEDGATKSIWANRYAAGSGWETPQRIAVGTSTSEGLQIAMDRAGNAIVVWSQYEPNVIDSSNIMAIRFIASFGWGTALSIDNETDDVNDPHLVFDAAGNAVVAWISYDGSRNNVRANRFE